MTYNHPLARGLFVDDAVAGDTVRLMGGRDRVTGRTVFPFPAANERFDPVPLGTEGTLWSFTVQRFRPKSPPYAGPEDFEPYAVGYVELPGEVIVESRLVGIPFDRLVIGLPVTLTTEALTIDGEPRIGFAFTRTEAHS
jgi:uncharacterized OB-fold protein